MLRNPLKAAAQSAARLPPKGAASIATAAPCCQSKAAVIGPPIKGENMIGNIYNPLLIPFHWTINADQD
jgi:hypothetical protein